MHKLLDRQIRRILRNQTERVPEKFLEAVGTAYAQADEDRILLERAMDITSEELLERNEALSRSLSLLQATLEATDDGILVTDLKRRIKTYNQHWAQLWNHPQELLDRRDGLASLDHAETQVLDPDRFRQRVEAIYRVPESESFDELRMNNGRIIERYSWPMRHEGEVLGRVWSFRDVTERRRLEEQIRQSQKMEAVGQLAGGIAHDFNNLLTVISGCCDLSRLKAKTESPDLVRLIEEIAKAAARAGELTSQLLTFSRRAMLDPEALVLDQAIEDLEDLLKRLLSENIELRVELGAGSATILADRSRFQQIVLNLVINASDAMPQGGRILIRTEIAAVESVAGVVPYGIQEPGEYAVLRVRDNGCGIPAAIQDRIFDPFFTTKDPGKGTGLGLATVYGIVEQFQGFLHLESVEGEGTELFVSLPLTELRAEDTRDEDSLVLEAKGTLLAVEDDPAVRLVMGEMLEMVRGFTVLMAASPEEAVERFGGDSDPGGIDLLITDIVMPGMSGFQLAETLSRRYPGLKVLFVSGYDPESPAGIQMPKPRAGFLGKPFDSESLIRKIQQVLASPVCFRE